MVASDPVEVCVVLFPKADEYDPIGVEELRSKLERFACVLLGTLGVARRRQKQMGIPSFDWQKSRMFVAGRDVYGFLFSVRRVFMVRSTCHSHMLPGSFSGQRMCYRGEAMRTEERNP